MKVIINKVSESWRDILNAARNTINKPAKDKTPGSEWKRKLLFSEHSPIRKLHIDWTWEGLKSWISVHFVRHKHGIEHFVSTQRDDLTGKSRDEASQGALVNHNSIANSSSIMYISRKRLCRKAHPETQAAWRNVLKEIEKFEPELFSVCVPECIYRNGICPEFKSCGFNYTKEFENERNEYIKQHKDQVSR